MNDIAEVLGAVFIVGCLGGVVNSLMAGGFKLPKVDPDAHEWRPGWVGNLVIGGVAALVFWGLYGPFANAILIGAGTTGTSATLKVGELCGALVTGIGGGRLLTTEVDKLILKREKGELSKARDTLATAMANLVKERA